MPKQLEQNVIDLIDRAAYIVGQSESQCFNDDVYRDLTQDSPEVCESPIEQMLFVALKTIAKLNLIDCDEGPEPPTSNDGDYRWPGLNIFPQKQIGNYRVDFFLTWESYRN